MPSVFPFLSSLPKIQLRSRWQALIHCEFQLNTFLPISFKDSYRSNSKDQHILRVTRPCLRVKLQDNSQHPHPTTSPTLLHPSHLQWSLAGCAVVYLDGCGVSGAVVTPRPHIPHNHTVAIHLTAKPAVRIMLFVIMLDHNVHTVTRSSFCVSTSNQIPSRGRSRRANKPSMRPALS